MQITANNPALRSWVTGADHSEFPIQNLPFGIFQVTEGTKSVGVRIGEQVLDLAQMAAYGYFDDLPFASSDFSQDYLNPLMQKGKIAVRALRNRIAELLSTTNETFQSRKDQHNALIPVSKVKMALPVQIGDYTDFYSSKNTPPTWALCSETQLMRFCPIGFGYLLDTTVVPHRLLLLSSL